MHICCLGHCKQVGHHHQFIFFSLEHVELEWEMKCLCIYCRSFDEVENLGRRQKLLD